MIKKIFQIIPALLLGLLLFSSIVNAEEAKVSPSGAKLTAAEATEVKKSADTSEKAAEDELLKLQ